MIPTTATITSSKHQTADARAIPQPAVLERPSVRGKFLFASGEKLLVRGVTYGAFRPDDRKREYYDLAQIDRDFRRMASGNFNAVRIPHTMPPRELLDIAAMH